MEHTIDCKVVMLPTKEVNRLCLHAKTILKWYDDIPKPLYECCVSQHLYFTSDEDDKIIRTGDKCHRVATNQIVTYGGTSTIYNGPLNGLVKVIASSDPSLGLPSIPQSFLQKYVVANGKITEVKLALNFRLHGAVYRDRVEHDEVTAFNNTLRITDKGEVVIVDNTPLIAYTSEFQELISKSEDKELEDAANMYRESNNIGPYKRINGEKGEAIFPNDVFKAGWKANPNKWSDEDMTNALDTHKWSNEDVAALIKERFNTGANWSPKVLAKWLEEYKNNKK